MSSKNRPASCPGVKVVETRTAGLCAVPTGVPVDWRTALAVFALALVVRLVFLWDGRGYPAFLVPLVDAANYDAAARSLATGQGFTNQFFWQPFLYPVFLAGIYAVAGPSILTAMVVQMVLGAVTCALTCVLGTRLLDRASGLAAGLIVALYGPLLFHESELLGVGLAAFWTPLFLLAVLGARSRPGLLTGLAVGIIGALAVLTRSEFLVPIAAAAVWLITLVRRTAPRRTVLTGASVLLGFGVAVMPAVRCNARQNGRMSFLPVGGGINFYLGNHPDQTRVATTTGFRWDELLLEASEGGPMHASEYGPYFWRQSWAYIAADPLGFVSRLGGKLAQFAAPREIARGSDVYVEREWSRMQYVLTWKAGGFAFPFGVLLPLAAFGLVVNWRRLPAAVVLYLGLFALAVALVFVTGRYRLPVVPVFAVLGGGGLVTVLRWVRAHRWLRLAGATGGVLVGGVLISLPGPFPLERAELNQGAGLYVCMGQTYDHWGQLDQALDCFQRELRGNPHCCAAYTGSARILTGQGRDEDALRCFQAALDLQPESYQTHVNLGMQLDRMNRRPEAVVQLRQAVALQPLALQVHRMLASVLADSGEYAAAELAATAGLRVCPIDPQLHILRAWALEHLGRRNEARAAYQLTLELAPDDVEAQTGLRRLSTPTEPPRAPG